MTTNLKVLHSQPLALATILTRSATVTFLPDTLALLALLTSGLLASDWVSCAHGRVYRDGLIS